MCELSILSSSVSHDHFLSRGSLNPYPFHHFSFVTGTGDSYCIVRWGFAHWLGLILIQFYYMINFKPINFKLKCLTKETSFPGVTTPVIIQNPKIHPKIFMPHINFIKVTSERSTNKIDEEDNYQDISIETLSLYSGKFTRMETVFLLKFLMRNVYILFFLFGSHFKSIVQFLNGIIRVLSSLLHRQIPVFFFSSRVL